MNAFELRVSREYYPWRERARTVSDDVILIANAAQHLAAATLSVCAAVGAVRNMIALFKPHQQNGQANTAGLTSASVSGVFEVGAAAERARQLRRHAAENNMGWPADADTVASGAFREDILS